jgi:DNA (cytosine-5)-methyltransferase 1
MATLNFLSVCSGIEAASLAWGPLGWKAAALSEIDPFPCHVLHHRFGASRPMFMPSPDEAGLSAKDRKARAAAIRAVAKLPEIGDVPNFGDMTQFERWPDAAFDVLVGGTPCQDYSIAGLRLGMDGSRGQLTLTYVEIAARYRPRWLVWENVPGVLSSNGGRDFARFLGEISGQRIDVPDGGWKNAGIVSGIRDAYGLAYRVLDAQFVRTRGHPRAVPQRRRRVFVVGYLGDWRRAAAVLFDAESLRGNPPPSRQAGQRPASTLAASTGGCSGKDGIDGRLISMAHGQGGAEIGIDHGPTLTCNHEAPIVAHSLRAEGFDASEDGTGRGTPIVPVPAPIAFDCLAGGETGLSIGDVPGALHGGGKSGGRAAIAFSSKDHGADAAEDVTPTLRAMGHADSHANAGGQLAVAFAENSRAELRLCGGDGRVMSQLTTGGGKPGQGQPTIALPWAVRRLTPVECERLQGMPDDHTMIPWRGRNGAPDGPRYKGLGNSMAVNAMEWLGARIDMVEGMP